MSGELQILLVVVLSVAVGAAALLYYLRTRGSPPQAEPASGGSESTRDRGATVLDDNRAEPPLPESGSREGTPGTNLVSSDSARRSDTAAGGPPAVAEPAARPDEATQRGELAVTTHKEHVATPSPTAAPEVTGHEEPVSPGEPEPDSALPESESEMTSTSDIAEPTKEGPPEGEVVPALSSAVETEVSPPGPSMHALPGTPDNGVATAEPRTAGTTGQSEVEDDHVHGSEGDEQAHMPAEAAPTANSEEAAPSDVAPVSPGDIAADEELDQDQAVREEQPSAAPVEDDAPASEDREDSDPEPALEVPSGGEGEAVERLDALVDEGERIGSHQTEATGEAAADRAPQTAETGTTAAAEETDRPAEEETSAEAVGSDDARGAEGVVAAGATSTPDDEQPSWPAAEDEADEGPDTDPVTVAHVQPPRKKRDRKKKPRKYKGLARGAPEPRDAAAQPGRHGGEGLAQRERSLPIEVRLRFDRGGFCNVSLIAKRSAGLPEDLTAVARGGEVNLRAMQDEWYQDVVPDDFSSVLRNGTVWTQEGANGRRTWSLSGRELYVLADRSDISGYVSQPCLDLGRDHVVLCSESLRNRVEEAIRETGSGQATVLDESFGAPPGWLVFRGVVPHAPVSPTDGADIFNSLRPLPRIEISLERGIRLGYINWLDGHPPSIRVYGDAEHASEVRIDGEVAERGADGSYRKSGWDAVGSHSVWCAGSSRSYSIVPFDSSWELWDAYAFPVALDGTLRLAVCGPIVRAAATEPWGSESFSVAETNPLLLGPEPGQIVMAVRASPLRGAPRIASPDFIPLWALPRDPLHCDKKTTRILCLGGSDAPDPKKRQGGRPNSGTHADMLRWCQLILDASRKGMTTEPDTESVRALWLSYKRLARRIWRSRR